MKKIDFKKIKSIILLSIYTTGYSLGSTSGFALVKPYLGSIMVGFILGSGLNIGLEKVKPIRKDILLETASENENISEASLISLRKLVPMIEDNPYFPYHTATRNIRNLEYQYNALYDVLGEGINGMIERGENGIKISFPAGITPESDPQTDLHELRHVLLVGSETYMREGFNTLCGIEYGTKEAWDKNGYQKELHLLRMILELVGREPVLEAESYHDDTKLRRALKRMLGSEKLVEKVMHSFDIIGYSKRASFNIDENNRLPEDAKEAFKRGTGITLIDGEYTKDDLVSYEEKAYTSAINILYQASKLTASQEQLEQMRFYYRYRYAALDNPLIVQKSYINMKQVREQEAMNKVQLKRIDDSQYITGDHLIPLHSFNVVKNRLKYDLSLRNYLPELNEMSGGELFQTYPMVENTVMYDKYGDGLFLENAMLQIEKEDLQGYYTTESGAMRLLIELVGRDTLKQFHKTGDMRMVQNQLMSKIENEKVVMKILHSLHYYFGNLKYDSMVLDEDDLKNQLYFILRMNHPNATLEENFLIELYTGNFQNQLRLAYEEKENGDPRNLYEIVKEQIVGSRKNVGYHLNDTLSTNINYISSCELEQIPGMEEILDSIGYRYMR